MEQRPNPDALLAQLQVEAASLERGKLKIFLGAAAGVGKTYAMLEATRQQKTVGVDVVIGYVETHGRVETEALVAGLEALPLRTLEYQGHQLHEFDLDGALERRPTLILVDELAHTNASGSRHTKRWQDVQELLEAGINVYTAVNVQHLESLNDTIAQITGVIVRETVPDSLVEQADEVKLVDLPPDDLLVRLREGKVYQAQQAAHASQNFFRKGNLLALRELALRLTADRVDRQMEAYRQDKAIAASWPARERLMVCISPGPVSLKLVRAAQRLAASLHAEWLAVYVETPAQTNLSEAARDHAINALRLAEQEKATETVTLSGQRVSEEILKFARQRNVSKIVIGKPLKPRWREILFGSSVDEIVRGSGSIDVYVITGDDAPLRSATPRPFKLGRTFKRENTWQQYLKSIPIIALCTLVAWLTTLVFPTIGSGNANLVMIYLLGVMISALLFGRGASLVAAGLSVASFDFFFIEPKFTFTVSDGQYLFTFAVLFIVAGIISQLTVRSKHQADGASLRERRTAALYAMSRELASTPGQANLLRIAAQHMSEVFDSQVKILLPGPHNHLVDATGSAILADREQGAAEWCYAHSEMAGAGTETLPIARSLYLPLVASRGIMGVLAIDVATKNMAQMRRFLASDQLHLLETFGNQTALALERAELVEETQHSQMQVEAERLRNSLLSSVSHDLRTPLATITGAASSLLEAGESLAGNTRRELTLSIYEEGNRLNRLVGNLLDMTRLEAGTIKLNKEWQPLEEVIGAALNHLDRQLRGRKIETRLAPDLPLVPLDTVLIEQVLFNLLENALKYTPAGSPIEIAAYSVNNNQAVTVEVADRGQGLPTGSEQRIFEKFLRLPPLPGQPSNHPGVGLGLAISQGFVAAHGGRIWAENRPDGGVIFRFSLPIEGQPPQLLPESGL